MESVGTAARTGGSSTERTVTANPTSAKPPDGSVPRSRIASDPNQFGSAQKSSVPFALTRKCTDRFPRTVNMTGSPSGSSMNAVAIDPKPLRAVVSSSNPTDGGVETTRGGFVPAATMVRSVHAVSTPSETQTVTTYVPAVAYVIARDGYGPPSALTFALSASETVSPERGVSRSDT